MIFVFYYRFMTKMLSEVTISWARQSLTFLKTLNSKCKCPEGCQLKKVVLLFVATKFALSFCISCRPGEHTLKLHEGSDDDLKARMVKKKKKTLGTINITLVMEPMSKEEYNEVTY